MNSILALFLTLIVAIRNCRNQSAYAEMMQAEERDAMPFDL